MKRTLALLLVGFVLFARMLGNAQSAAPANANPKPGYGTSKTEEKELKVSGRLVDVACYKDRHLRGRQLDACTQKSLKPDSRVGILAGNILYVVRSDNENVKLGERFSRLAGKNVTVFGIRAPAAEGGTVLVLRTVGGELAR